MGKGISKALSIGGAVTGLALVALGLYLIAASGDPALSLFGWGSWIRIGGIVFLITGLISCFAALFCHVLTEAASVKEELTLAALAKGKRVEDLTPEDILSLVEEQPSLEKPKKDSS